MQCFSSCALRRSSMCRIGLILVLCVLWEASCTDESLPRLRLDPELRRALLRALTQLELEAQRNAGIENPTLQTSFDDQPIDEEQEANIKRDLEALLDNYENFQATKEPEELTTVPVPENEDQTFNYHTSAEEVTTLNKEEGQEVSTFDSQSPLDVTTASKDDDQNFTVFNFHSTLKDSTTSTHNGEDENSGFSTQAQDEEIRNTFHDNDKFSSFNTHVPTKELTTITNNDDQNFDIIKFHSPTIIGNKDPNFDASPKKAQTEENNDEPNFDIVNFHTPPKELLSAVANDDNLNFDIINFHGSPKESTADSNNKDDNKNDHFDSTVRSLSKELTVNNGNVHKLNSIQTSAKDITDIKPAVNVTNEKVTEENNAKFGGQSGDDLQRQESGSLVENQEGSAIFFKDDSKIDNEIQSNLISPGGDENDKKKNKKQVEHEVSIFEAPLVAAFTLEQDERGNPKSVVPLLRPLNKPTIPSSSTTPPTQIHQNSPPIAKQNTIQQQDSIRSSQNNKLFPGTHSETFGNRPLIQNQQSNFQPSPPLTNQQTTFTPNSFVQNQQNIFQQGPSSSNQQNNFQKPLPQENTFESSPNQQNGFKTSNSFVNVQNNGNFVQNTLLNKQTAFQQPLTTNLQNNFQRIPPLTNQQNSFDGNPHQTQQNSFLQVPSISDQQISFQQSPTHTNQQNIFQRQPVTNQQNNFQQSHSFTNQPTTFQRSPVFTNQQTTFQSGPSHIDQQATIQQVPSLTNQQNTLQNDPFPINEHGLVPPPLNQDHIYQPAATQLNPQQISHSVTVEQSVEPSQEDLLTKERELEHRTRLLEQQLIHLRQQQHLQHQQQLQFQQQQILKQQQLLLQEQQRVKQQRQLQERQRFQEPPGSHRTQRQESGTGIVDFQRSIGIQFGHQTIHQPLQSIQNLLYQSGIAGDLQSNIRNGASPNEDLSLVSRILALNHEGRNESVRSQTSHTQSTNQEDLRVVNKVLSLNHIDKVQPPSRFITPPFV